MNQITSMLTSKEVMKFIKQVEGPFKGLPHLPKGLVDFLVKIAPWLVGLSGILGIFSGLNLLGIGLGWSGSYLTNLLGISATYYIIAGVVQWMMAAISLMAFKPLKAMQMDGWVLMFDNFMLSVIFSVAQIFFNVSSPVGTVIGLLIGLYVLFEVKVAYKK